MKTRKKHAANKKKSANILEVERKDVTLHRNTEINLNNIGIWCNGNTADSGPAFPGSSPGIPTKRNLPHGKFLLFSSNNAFLSLSITASTMFILSACRHNLWYHYLCALCALCESSFSQMFIALYISRQAAKVARTIYTRKAFVPSAQPMYVLCLTMQGFFY